MKTKAILVGMFALTVGICSAFASYKTAVTAAYIKVSYTGSSAFECVDSGFTCNDTAGTTCKILISDLNGAAAFARSTSTCPTPNLVDSNTNGVAGTYDDDRTIDQINNLPTP